MTFCKFALLLGLSSLLAARDARGVTTILSDNYNVTGSGSGFGLDTGINSGIDPPATRLTGSAKANLRYIHTGTKTNTAYTITNNRIQVSAAPNPGRFVFSSDGATPFDFATALGTGTASPASPVAYDLSIRMNNDSAAGQRFSFALGNTEGDATTWDFGFQVYRTDSTDDFYAVGKRINSGSSGLAGNLNKVIATLTPNTYGGDITVLMRVTDAGAETTTFNSRVRLSLNGGNSWFYDTDADPDLPNGWRLNGSGRHIMWDIAPDAGPVSYDAFSLKLNPPASNVNTSSTFRVMTYNIHWAAGPDGKVNTQRIADFIISQNVDLVGFNEVARFMSSRASGRDIIGELAQQTGMAYVFSNNNTSLTGNDQFGNAILSKYPILFRDHRLLPRVGDNEQRGWLKAIVDVGGKFVSFWTTHLDFRADDTERLMCGTNFNTWLPDETFPVIFCGDFNDTPGTSICNLMDNKWTDIWPVAGDGSLGRTVPCPGPPFNARIDYIWKATSSTALIPTNAEVGYGIEASDHYPALTQFVLTNFASHAPGFYFPLDQGNGTKITDSITGLTGNFGTNAPVWSTNSPVGQAGDHSLYFDGTKKITVTDTNQIIGTNGLNDDYTLQAWVKVAINYAPPQRAILFQYDRKPGFSFSINTNRTLHTTAFKIKDISSGATLPNDGQWHHLAVVHTDRLNMKFYIDAVLAATVVYTNGAGFRTSSDITIGSAADNANPFTGYLDRIKFDDRALGPAQFDFPAVPTLGVRRSANLLTLYWPGSATNYTLQVNDTLRTNGWVNASSQLQDGENQATIAATNSAKYFRLRR
jgi:endonuclease/exonuclease/phosphatase family metal-dependent hydrolase